MKTYFLILTILLLSSCSSSERINEPIVSDRGVDNKLALDNKTHTVILSPSKKQLGQALVIGNNNYEYSQLRNPVNDATDIAQLLSKIGFTVTLKTNLNQKSMDKVIRQFAKGLNEQGAGLFYFAGHGAQVNGQNYLLPIDNEKIQEEEDLKYNAVSASRILERMGKTKTTLNIIILDACRNNPYRGVPRGLRGLSSMQSSGSIIAFATASGKSASDSSKSGRNGLFTSHLLKALKNAHNNHQRIDDMLMQVQNAVSNESNNKQVPWYMASLSSPFCLGSGKCLTQDSIKQKASIARSKNGLVKGTDALREFEDTFDGFGFKIGTIQALKFNGDANQNLDLFFEDSHGFGTNNNSLDSSLNGVGGIIDMGYKKLDEVLEAPVKGYKPYISRSNIFQGHTYCVRTADGKHYGKIHILEINKSQPGSQGKNIVFSWVYQPNKTRSFVNK